MIDKQEILDPHWVQFLGMLGLGYARQDKIGAEAVVKELTEPLAC